MDNTKNYFIEETNQNKMLNKKQTNACAAVNYIEDLLILASTVT